jgi:2,4-dichlorophenol 6-monooxygenase
LHYASIHFKADLPHYKTGLLWFIVNKATGTFIAYNRRNSWVYFIRYNPATHPKTTFTSEYMKRLVVQVQEQWSHIELYSVANKVQAIGREVPDYEECGVTIWTTSPQLARTYRSPTISNAFLAGDAARSFPPTGGLGVNTGVADVQNMVWKIHAVECGWLKSSLLDSVTSERLPVARENCRQSKVNEDKVFRLVDSSIQENLKAQEILTTPSAYEKVKQGLAENCNHFHSLNLQLGYVYGQELRGVPRDHRKEVTPGARLPHFWIERHGHLLSTLDLVDGLGFVLSCASGFTEHIHLDLDGVVPIAVKQIRRDFNDPAGDLSRFLVAFSQRALLIRPDQHIVGSARAPEEVLTLLKLYLECFSVHST